METMIFTCYDSKAQAYLPPFYMHNENLAQRAFMNCINDPTHQFGANPGDYTLMKIGSFDDTNAQLESHAPVSMGNGLEYITHQKDETQNEIHYVEPVQPDSPG